MNTKEFLVAVAQEVFTWPEVAEVDLMITEPGHARITLYDGAYSLHQEFTTWEIERLKEFDSRELGVLYHKWRKRDASENRWRVSDFDP